MEYKINPKSLGGMIPLPQKVLSFLPHVSGDALKVLILIFERPTPPKIGELARALSLSESQVIDGIRFWVDAGVLVKVAEPKEPTLPLRRPDASSISTEELMQAKKQDESIAYLFDESEKILKRPLKPAERRTLLYAHETTNLPVDVVLMIVDYCQCINRASARQIQSTCEFFCDQGIFSHEQAEEQIQFLLEKNEQERLVCNCFGIHNRNLTTRERRCIERWMTEYGFTLNLIQIAYEKAVDATGKLSFAYIDKILKNWHEHGVQSPEDIEKLDRTVKSAKQTKKQPSYDLEEMSKQGLFIPE